MILAVIIILLINSLGFYLRINDYDRYIILLGFRFHLTALLTLLLFIKTKYIWDIESIFQKRLIKFNFKYLLTIFLSILIFPVILYSTGNMKFIDPNYLYEFGVSSIFDFPIYLIWNLPQLIFVNVFLLLLSKKNKFPMLIILPVLLMLNAFEIIPLPDETFSYENLIIYSGVTLLYAAFLGLSRNVVFSASILFTVIWANILLFGSRSEMFVHTFLAKNYSNWQGFFQIKNELISDYSILIQFSILFVLFLSALLVNSRIKTTYSKITDEKNNNISAAGHTHF